MAEPYEGRKLSRAAFGAADRRIGASLKKERARLRFLEQIVDVPLGGVEDLARWWEHAPHSSKRSLTALLVEKVLVHPARARGVRDVDDRVTLSWRTEMAA
ncbi:hypothetical protein AB0N14_20565 [Streptomyces sp. NPDC051104]|uniref:hypothetical protein n=1 Tax=Streptomyces sp. NPDC051104 TaxID=3155044 RepID=UPI00342EE08A